MTRHFSKIFIANRGEIACRIMQTARGMGYRTVAVFSDADAHARHVALADEAISLGGSTATESYLDINKLLTAAKRAGADAVHPGYGFLSESAAFAEASRDAGLVFIGPSPAAIHAMGNKAAAKRLMLKAGVPCIPGYQGSEQTDARLLAEARKIGVPVMVKAAAGGGGRGIRLVVADADLPAALAAARREALATFGSDELILEKAVVDGRHIEIQIFGDEHGNIIHLGERDCSIQRRHQKVIEEGPSPAVGVELRTKMGAAAVAAAKAIDYTGAGTVEFLLDDGGHFYFLEMNTRIQVEHPVTEAITGFDLVRWQIEAAAGAQLPVTQADIAFTGHAIEARLYAEDPHAGFLPRSGRIVAWEFPVLDGVRVDHGLATAPTEISAHYDPMIAKIIAHGDTREAARRRLILALEETHVHGITTNRAFLLRTLRHKVFIDGNATTGFIPQQFGAKSAALARPEPDPTAIALAATLLHGPTSTADGWRSTGARAAPLKLTIKAKLHVLKVMQRRAYLFDVEDGNGTTSIELSEPIGNGTVRFANEGYWRTAHAVWDGERLHLDLGELSFTAEDLTLTPRILDDTQGAATLRAPMNGRIVAVHATAGDKVAKGQRLVVLEAMKMQHEINAERDGTIEALPVKIGDQVATRQVLVQLRGEG